MLDSLAQAQPVGVLSRFGFGRKPGDEFAPIVGPSEVHGAMLYRK